MMHGHHKFCGSGQSPQPCSSALSVFPAVCSSPHYVFTYRISVFFISERGGVHMQTTSSTMVKVDFWFLTLFAAHVFAAFWCPILDCDEVFNYWEPLHNLIHGSGLQTWEYAPTYALRSYLYLLLHSPIVYIAKVFIKILTSIETPISLFYFFYFHSLDLASSSL
jgi:hypothetical protein